MIYGHFVETQILEFTIFGTEILAEEEDEDGLLKRPHLKH